MQPGETITPGGTMPEPQPQSQQPAAVVAPISPPAPEAPTQDLPTPEVAPQVQPQAPEPVAPAEPALYNPEPSQPPIANLDPISWSASEYIDHPKGAKWFVLFGFGLAIIVLVTYFATRDIITPILIGVAGMIFGAFAARPPEVLNYGLDNSGLTISQKHYLYSEFKSFSVMDEGPFRSILLAPLKRFMPPITVYYDPKDEDTIIDILADFLPLEQQQHDLTDQLMRRLRF